MKHKPRVAIVDYGMGNLFSVKQACAHVGLDAQITSLRQEVLNADAVILPGIGAFQDAMATLRELRLDSALQTIAASDKPLIGICLGMQLLMDESFEFGQHRGLGIICGSVVRLQNGGDGEQVYKVPQVCWNRLYSTEMSNGNPWRATLLEGLPNGVYMYFVHSYYVQPHDTNFALATTRYGENEFVSALRYRNVFACQCHPERSGADGLRVYWNLATYLRA